MISNKDFSLIVRASLKQRSIPVRLDRLFYKGQVFNLRSNSYALKNRGTIFK